MNLEDRLDRLRQDVTFPPAPASATMRWPEITPARSHVHKVLAASAVAAVILILVLVAVPDTRSTLARWLDLGAIQVRIVDRFTEDGEETSPLDPLVVGEPVAVNDLTSIMAMPGQIPDAAYRHVFDNGSTAITIVYRADEVHPEIESSGVGIILTVTDAPFGMMGWIKQAESPPGASIVTVRGVDGVWILSGQLVIERDDPDGSFGLSPTTRRTGHVLIWQEDGVTYRLETRSSRSDAIALAESLVPFPEPK